MGAGLTVAVVGLGFGRDFVPLYLSHPDVERVVLVDPDAATRTALATLYGLDAGHADPSAVLADPGVDAVHLLTPVHTHADLAVAALQAGKHVACAVPMATTDADIARIAAAQRASGTTYAMMETAVLGREFLAVRELHEQGRLAAARTGGGFDNSFPTEIALLRLEGSDVLAEVWMAFSQTARSYLEGFSLYGDRGGVEWPADNTGPLTLHEMSAPAPGQRGNPVVTRTLEPPDRAELLPEALRRFVRPTRVRLPGMTAAVEVGAHHGGSHPFLVDDFVRSVVDGRRPLVDLERAAAFTAPGIAAHRSALAGGATVAVVHPPG